MWLRLLVLLLACESPTPTDAAPAAPVAAAAPQGPPPSQLPPGPVGPPMPAPAHPAFGSVTPSPAFQAALDAATAALGRIENPAASPGTGTLERAVFTNPGDTSNLEAFGRSLVDRFPALFGGIASADLVVTETQPGTVRFHQVRAGYPVYRAEVELRVDDRNNVVFRGLVLPAGPDAKLDAAGRTAAIAAAARALTADPIWSKRSSPSSLTDAEIVWWAPRLLFPEADPEPTLAWHVYNAHAANADVVVSPTGQLLYVHDFRQPPGQLHSELTSYLPAPGTDRPFAAPVYKLLEVGPGSVIADIGAGSGAFTWPLSAKVGPTGTIYANDVDDVAVDFLERRLRGDPPPYPNIKVVRAFTDDQRLPAESLDGALLCQVHFFLGAEPDSWRRSLQTLYASMKPGGRVVVIETRSNGDLAALRHPFESVGFTFDREEPVPEAAHDWVVRFLR